MNTLLQNSHLLVALNVLLEEKQVTKAAERMNLSQPAMSRILQKLRVIFSDPLLVKSANGLCLTPKAKDLYLPLKKIVEDITKLYSDKSFDPAVTRREIVIATRDYETAIILPKIMNAVSSLAPEITFRTISLISDDLSPLENQEVDFVLSGSESNASTLSRYPLYKESFSCLVSVDNAILKKKLTLSRYLEMKHCLVSIHQHGQTMVDKMLQKQQLTRKIVVNVPVFLAAANLVANSDLILTLPCKLATYLTEQKNLVIPSSTIKFPSFPIYLYWHRCNQNSPVHLWLRQLVKGLVL